MDYHLIIASQYATRKAMQNRPMDVDEFYATHGYDYFAFVRKFGNIVDHVVLRGQMFRRRLTMQKPDLKAQV